MNSMKFEAGEEGRMRDLAERLEAYWRERGYAVRAWAERVAIKRTDGAHGASTHWVVRSDMVNGIPTRRIGL